MLLVASPGEAQVAPTGAAVDQTVRGPFNLLIFPTSLVPHASGTARLVYAESPFGIATNEDGHAVYDMRITLAGLPLPAKLGHYTTYVAWAASPDLSQWVRLGTVHNGVNTVGSVDMNKFLLVLSVEATETGTQPAGPTVLHGTSPSGYIQSFLSHPLFKNVPQ